LQHALLIASHTQGDQEPRYRTQQVVPRVEPVHRVAADVQGGEVLQRLHSGRQLIQVAPAIEAVCTIAAVQAQAGQVGCLLRQVLQHSTGAAPLALHILKGELSQALEAGAAFCCARLDAAAGQR